MEAQTEDICAGIEIRSANEWMREAGRRRAPKMLFGELWLEGELSVLFADTGAGKSVLAAAIAETIARGRPLGPFEVTTRPQKVLYIDLDLSAKQFEMRYSAEHDPASGDFLRKPYRFSERFQRIELKSEHLPQPGSSRFAAELRGLLEALVKKAGASVLIIDGISHLRRTADDTRGWADIFKALKSLTSETGISVLALAHALKRSSWRPLAAADALGSRSISNYADNIFTIGRCRRDAGLRYIKHIRPRSSEPVYGTEHVPVFRLAKIGGNFLGFDLKGFAPEADLLDAWAEQQDWQTVEQVKNLSDAGLTIRRIAADLGISKSAVHRHLHTPLPERAAFAGEGDEIDGEEEAVQSGWNYFPGREEFNAASADPRFYGIYEREDAEAHALRREAYLIDVAKANARKQYLKTGHAPTFAEAWAEVLKDLAAREKQRNGEFIETESSPEASDPTAPDKPNPSAIFGTTAPLKLSFDGYGREIFVETEDEYTRKPTIWYHADPKGNKFRHVRNGDGISIEQLRE